MPDLHPVQTQQDRTPLTDIERLAEFKKAIALAQTTTLLSAKTLGVSYNHLFLVLKGERLGSEALERRIAEFLSLPVAVVFGKCSVRHRSRGSQGAKPDSILG